MPCARDVATCATGLAEWSSNGFFCPTDYPTGSVANGGGELCYDSDHDCLGGPNACNSNTPCVYDTATCSTGQAAGALSSNWFCPAVVPPGAVHNGAGERCYDSAYHCSNAPNQCDGNSDAYNALTSPLHCYENNATCASGQSGGQGHVFFCDQTQPPGSIPNGAGQLCYNQSSWCMLGPNACGASVQQGAIVLGGQLAAGGQWGGAAFSAPPTVLGTWQQNNSVTSRGGAVVGCVSSLLYSDTNFSVAVVTANCSNLTVVGEALGANHTVYDSGSLLGLIDPAGPGAAGNATTLLFSIAPITAPGGSVAPAGAIVGTVTVVGGTNFSVSYGAVSCQLDLVTCASGQAGPTSNNWFCETDYPAGSVANGAGQLCYSSAETCVNGPNACGASQPCALDTATCATGAGAGLGFNYYCEYSTPLGGIPAGSGQLCFDSYAHCMNAPNACNPASEFGGAFNAAFNCTVRTDLCSTGQAGGTANVFVCPADVPGAALTAAGKPAGTAWQALSDNGTAVALPNGAGAYCWDTLADCTAGLNSCSSSSPCVQDFVQCSTGAAGSYAPANSYFCPSDAPLGSIANEEGLLCYDTFFDCQHGPNACDTSNPCAGPPIASKLCSSGSYMGSLAPQSSPPPSLTSSLALSPPPPGGACTAKALQTTEGPFICLKSVPVSSATVSNGLACFSCQSECESAPNSCNADTPCVFQPSLCSYGAAAGASASWTCEAEMPRGGLPNSAGLLCFDSLTNCHHSPTACSDSPGRQCTFNTTLCSSGLASTSSNSYFCGLSMPHGATVPDSGIICYDGKDTCLGGPNSCDSVSAPCVVPTLPGVCPSGQFMCPQDLPLNATVTPSGLCFSTSASCETGTPCDYLSLPCSTSTSCPASAPYICKLATVPKSANAAFFVSFSLAASNTSNTTVLATRIAFAALLNISVADVNVTAPNATAGRRLLAGVVQLSVTVTSSSNATAVSLTSTIATIPPSTLALALPPGVQPPVGGLRPTVLAPASALPMPIMTYQCLSTELGLSRPTIWILRHLVMGAGDGVAMRVPAGSNVTIVGNTSACLGGANISGTWIAGDDPTGTGLCTLDASYLSQHFLVSKGSSLTLINFALVNGAARGADGSDTTFNGGSVNAGAGSSVTFINCTFANNSALYGTGGAVYTAGDVTYGDDTTFVGLNNTAFAGFEMFTCNPDNVFFDNTTGLCPACPPGQLLTSANPLTCKICPSGTYWPGGLPPPGVTDCTACPFLTSTTGTGAPHVAFCNCVAGFFRTPMSNVSDPGSVICSPCPDGAVCPGQGDNRAYALEGFWRGDSVDSVEFYECEETLCVEEEHMEAAMYSVRRLDRTLVYPAGSIAVNDVNTSFDAGGLVCVDLHQPELCISPERTPSCRAGHAGLLCGLCEPGFTIQNGLCVACADGARVTDWGLALEIIVAIVGGTCIILFLMLLVWYPLLPPVWKERIADWMAWVTELPSRALRVVKKKVSAAIAKKEKARQERKYKKLIDAMSHHSSELFVCVMIIVADLQIVGSFKESMAVPWPKAYATFGVILRAVNIQLFKLPGLACTVPKLGLYQYTESLTLFTATVIFFLVTLWYVGFKYALRAGRFTRKQLVKYTRRDYVMLLGLLKALYIPLSEAILSLFLCEDFEGVFYMKMDLSQQCNTPLHSLYIVLGVVWTIIFPIGVPLMYLHSLVFYRVPYLVNVKFEVEYLRRLIEVLSREPDFDDSLIDHDRLTLDLDPAITELLWNMFIKDYTTGAPLPVWKDLEGRWQIDRASGEARKARKLAHKPSFKKSFKLAVASLEAALAHVGFISKGVKYFTKYFTKLHDRLYGIEPPRTENEFKVRYLVAYAKEKGYAVEMITWEGRPFPEGSREAKMQSVAMSACGFLFEEFQCQAWVRSLCVAAPRSPPARPPLAPRSHPARQECARAVSLLPDNSRSSPSVLGADRGQQGHHHLLRPALHPPRHQHPGVLGPADRVRLYAVLHVHQPVREQGGANGGLPVLRLPVRLLPAGLHSHHPLLLHNLAAQ